MKIGNKMFDIFQDKTIDGNMPEQKASYSASCMKAVFIFVCTAFLQAMPLTAEKEKTTAAKTAAAYDRFLSVNASYAEANESVIVKQVISQIDSHTNAKNSDTAYCLFHKNGQCVKIAGKSGIQYFFSSDQGFWLYTKKLKNPLKISGSYKVEEFEVQDILKTDFKNEYEIAEVNGHTLILERKTSIPAYKYILFSAPASNQYELIFTDTKKKPVRKLVYYQGQVSGINCFTKIDVYNLLFSTEVYRSWVTEWIKPALVPDSLFTYSQIKALSQRIESLIK